MSGVPTARSQVSKAYDKVVGARVRAIREKNQLTQAGLGRLVDIDPFRMNRVESGGYSLRLYEAAKIAARLGVDITDVVPSAVPPWS